jgi:4-carboxymuconolactone decarboxylase
MVVAVIGAVLMGKGEGASIAQSAGAAGGSHAPFAQARFPDREGSSTPDALTPGKAGVDTAVLRAAASARGDPHTGEDAMSNEMFEKGLKVRREVLGAEYVDKAIAGADDFNRPLQELVTSYCWGEIWNRPGLDRRTRSMLNLAMLTALNRPHEVKLHVRGAINNGLTKDEIREVLLQAGIYCGVPAAIDSFRIAREVFAEMGI